MKLEELGAPFPSEPPERRYASLHRTIEAGLANDKTWHDLVQTCLLLKKFDEALSASSYIDDPTLRQRAQRLLSTTRTQVSDSDRPRQRVRPVQSSGRPLLTEPQCVGPDSIKENVLDAFRFLFSEHMPLTVIFATLTFPLVVGLGGFLTKDSQAFVFPLIALIPALSVVGLVGALGRRIMRDASHGLDDAPAIPGVVELTRDAARFLLDAGVLGTVFLGPGLLMLSLGTVSTLASLATVALGVFLLPMALAIRQVSHDWRALSPNVLFKTITTSGLRYAVVAFCAAVLFTPAGLSAWHSTGSALFLQISVVGPLIVAPLFVVARLLGQLLFQQRQKLEAAFGEAPSTSTDRDELVLAHTKPRPEPRPQSARPETPSTPQVRAVPHTTSRQHSPLTPPRGSLPKAKPRPAEAPQVARRAPAATRVKNETRVEVEAVTSNSTPINQQQPDLSSLPGACVVRGDERTRAGASSSRSRI